MKKISLYIPINPIPASRPRVTRYGTFYSDSYETFRKELGYWLNLNVKGDHYLKGGISIDKLIFRRKIPKSYSQKKKSEMQGKYITHIPDIDNMLKSIKDSLSIRLFKDDCQICRIGLIEKYWDERGSIEIELSEMPKELWEIE